MPEQIEKEELRRRLKSKNTKSEPEHVEKTENEMVNKTHLTLPTLPKSKSLVIPNFKFSEFNSMHAKQLEKSMNISYRTSIILIPPFSVTTLKELQPIELSNTFNIFSRKSAIIIPKYFTTTFKPLKPYILSKKFKVRAKAKVKQEITNPAKVEIIKPVKPKLNESQTEQKQEYLHDNIKAETKTEKLEPNNILTGDNPIEKFFKGVGRLRSANSALILIPRYKFGDVEVSFSPIFAAICSELYRIHSGVPKIIWHSVDAKIEVEEFLSAEGNVYVVDMDEKDIARIRKGKLKDRLREVSSQNGYVIFSVPKDFYEIYEKLCDEMSCWINVIKITPKITSGSELLNLLARFWGFTKSKFKIENLSDAIMSFKNDYYKVLKKSYSIEFENLIVSDLDAGEEHEGLKKFTVFVIAKELGAKNEKDVVKMLENGIIQTEYDTGKFIADIRVFTGSEEFYEIETFYGTGEPISRKLLLVDKSGYLGTIKKYEGLNVKLNIVVQPLHALLYYGKLKEIEKLYKENPEVKFYVPDLTKRRLVRFNAL